MLRQPLTGHFAPCLEIQDTLGFWIPRCGFRIPDSSTGFRIRVIGTWILDSNRLRDFGFLKLYSGFQSPGFRIPQSKISPIPDSTSKNFSDSGIRITLHGLKSLLILSTQTISVILEQNACTHYPCSLWIGDKRPFCLYYQSFILCELTLFWS